MQLQETFGGGENITGKEPKPSSKRTISRKIAVHPDNLDAYLVTVSLNFASKLFPYGWSEIFPAYLLVKDATIIEVKLKKAKK